MLIFLFSHFVGSASEWNDTTPTPFRWTPSPSWGKTAPPRKKWPTESPSWPATKTRQPKTPTPGTQTPNIPETPSPTAKPDNPDDQKSFWVLHKKQILISITCALFVITIVVVLVIIILNKRKNRLTEKSLTLNEPILGDKEII